MFCPKCGTKNDDNAWKCTSCGELIQQTVPAGQPAVPGAPPVPVSIPNYLVWSILVTICCCLPFGIPAIVYAAQVNTKIGSGDIAGAMESSKKAKMWCWIAFGVGLPAQIIAAIIQIISLANKGGGSW